MAAREIASIEASAKSSSKIVENWCWVAVVGMVSADWITDGRRTGKSET